MEKTQQFLRNRNNLEVFLIYSGVKGEIKIYASPGLDDLIEEAID